MSDGSEQDVPPEPRYDPRAGGRPGLATFLGALVMLLPLAAPKRDEPAIYDWAGKIGALAGSAAFGLIVWAVCYAITIRRASRRWKIASLVVLILFGLFNGFISVAQRNMARDADEALLTARLKALAAADPATATFNAGADAGPMTRLTAAGAAPIIADARALAAAQRAAGLPQVLSFDGLTHGSPVLDHCDRVAALAAMTEANTSRFAVYVAAARKEGDALIADGKLSPAEVTSFITGMTNGEAKFARQNGLTARIAEAGAEMCRILAKQRWTRGADGKLAFTNAGDLAAARAVQARLDPLLAEFDANRRAGLAGLDKPPAR